MALLPIITAPDPRLKIQARPVAKVDAKVRRLMDDMLETMYHAIGIGLAAPQVGAAQRVLVVDVARPRAIRLRYLDHENEIREIEAEGLLATCLQHEIDHLDGVLFVDHISTLKRGMILKKLAKAKRSRTLQPA